MVKGDRMDPEQLLKDILEEIRESRGSHLRDEEKAGHCRSLGNKVEELVRWLAKGGYSPDWKTLLRKHDLIS